MSQIESNGEKVCFGQVMSTNRLITAGRLQRGTLHCIFKTETTTRCTIIVIYLLDMRAAYYFVDLKTQTLHNVGSEDDSSV